MSTTNNVIKPFYSVLDFSKIFGYSTGGTRKFMKNLGIKETLAGNKVIYLLTDIETGCPEFLPSHPC